MHGKGKTTWNNGQIFEGEFFNDKRQGLGKFNDGKNLIWIGFWENGKENGKGVTIINGKVNKEEWLNGNKTKNYNEKEMDGFAEIHKIMEKK